MDELFSSPFIEERLYLRGDVSDMPPDFCSRPLLSRSGCIYELCDQWFQKIQCVLVPFYRGAVVFKYHARL